MVLFFKRKIDKNNDKLAIFDFDGTIVDTFEMGVAFIRENGPKYGVNLQKYQPRICTLEENIANSKVSYLKTFLLLRAAKKYLAPRIDIIPIFPHISKQLKNIHDSNIKIAIISSNSNEVIQGFLIKHKLDHLIHKVVSGSSLFGKHKLINSTLEDWGIKNENAIYIGDEVRDVKATKKSRIRMIAVEWGWDSKDNLVKSNPEFLCDDMRTLSQQVIRALHP